MSVGASDARDVAIARVLTEWYGRAKRDLPWRRQRDAYGTWISEIMLQQTRVATVIPYWQRWMAAFPTASALADAPLDDVLQVWAGLGYYSRARNLHRGAQVVVQQHAGQLPRTAAALRTIVGIGPYTAGAVASIAYGERTPLVDGNVARVLARVDGVQTDIKAPATLRGLWQRATALVAALPLQFPAGDFNQALMELGALVCTPKSPQCQRCPLQAQALCWANTHDATARLPVVRARKKTAELPELKRSALWLTNARGDVLLARRRPSGLWGGLWELPTGESFDEVRAWFGARLAVPGPVWHHRQVLSHRRLSVDVYLAHPQVLGKCGLPSYEAVYDSQRFVAVAAITDAGIAAATRAIVAAYKDAPWNSIPKPKASSPKASLKSSKASRRSAMTPPTPTLPKPLRGQPKASVNSSTIKAKPSKKSKR